jgi:glutaredoxin
MLVKAVREGLGRVIIFIDYITRPGSIHRSPEAQREVENAAAGLSLYQFYACPFCVRTRRTIHRLNVPIELRDAQHDQAHREALLSGGGKIKVPCLRIEEHGEIRWLYESAAIIEYLNERFEDFETTTSRAKT